MIYLITNQKELFDRPNNSGIELCTIEESISALSKLKVISADIETTGLDSHNDKILSIQLGNFDNQYVIDTTTVDIQKYKDLLMNENIKFIWHNAGFDLTFLFKHKLYTPNLYDIFLAESVLTRGIPPGQVSRSLYAIAHKYCDVHLDKSVRNNIAKEGLTDRVIRYGADDIKYLEPIMNIQNEKINELNLAQYLSLENQFVIPLAYTVSCGFYLDKEQWNIKAKEDQENLDKLTARLNDYIVENHINSPFVERQLNFFEDGIYCNVLWSSSAQVVKVFEYFDLDVQIYEKGKFKKSVDQKHILKLVGKHPIVEYYMEYNKAAKLVSTYGKDFTNFINKKTGRVHTTYNQILNTGRISSGKSDKKNPKNSRPNLQNIPSDERHRSCFKAEEGNVLEVGDYSGQEQIVLANVSMEPKLLEFYDKDLGDMHSYISQQLFPELKDVSLRDIKKNYAELRQIAKAVGFSINYGGSDYTIARAQNMDPKRAKEIYDDYFKAFPQLREYFRKVQTQSIKDGYITINNISNSKTFIHNIDELRDLSDIIQSPGFWDTYRIEKEKNSDVFKYDLKPMVRNYFVIRGNIERDALNFPGCTGK